MRVGVIADSHGFVGELGNLLMKMEAEGPVDALIHLGDGYGDLHELGAELPPVYQVAGNCDFFRDDTLWTITLSGARLVLTHGHKQHVKQRGTEELLLLGKFERAQAVLYGHTHVQKAEVRDGVLLLNPGSAESGHYAVLNIRHDGTVTP